MKEDTRGCGRSDRGVMCSLERVEQSSVERNLIRCDDIVLKGGVQLIAVSIWTAREGEGGHWQKLQGVGCKEWRTY